MTVSAIPQALSAIGPYVVHIKTVAVIAACHMIVQATKIRFLTQPAQVIRAKLTRIRYASRIALAEIVMACSRADHVIRQQNRINNPHYLLTLHSNDQDWYERDLKNIFVLLAVAWVFFAHTLHASGASLNILTTPAAQLQLLKPRYAKSKYATRSS